MALFLKILLTEFIAEMGDKTQLMLVALTSRYKIRDIVIGTAAAVLVLNGIAVLIGHARVSHCLAEIHIFRSALRVSIADLHFKPAHARQRL